MIRLEKTLIGYGTCSLFAPMDIEFPPEKITCVLGVNGTGKSTLIRSILGLQPLLGGMCFLGTEELQSMSAERRARKLAAVFAENQSLPYLTVREVLEMTRDLVSMPDTEYQEYLQLYKMEPFLERSLGSLSSGEKQSVFVLRALLQNPKVLFLDEPGSHLDPLKKRELWHWMRREVDEKKRTLIWSTHDWERACTQADFLLCLKKSGKVELLKAGECDPYAYFGEVM